jgi:hypothetical protein
VRSLLLANRTPHSILSGFRGSRPANKYHVQVVSGVGVHKRQVIRSPAQPNNLHLRRAPNDNEFGIVNPRKPCISNSAITRIRGKDLIYIIGRFRFDLREGDVNIWVITELPKQNGSSKSFFQVY